MTDKPTTPRETLEMLVAQGQTNIEADSKTLQEKQEQITEEEFGDVMTGMELAFGLMSVTVMHGLTRIATEVVETGSCQLDLFKGLDKEQTERVADGFARAMSAVLANVEENRQAFANGVQMRLMMEHLADIIGDDSDDDSAESESVRSEDSEETTQLAD